MNTELIVSELENKCKLAKSVSISKESSLCSYLRFITIDALDKKDYPNNISNNSIYMTFTYNDNEKSLELHSNGHVYLSEADLQTPEYKYLCMKSIQKVHVDMGGKKFRKTKIKSDEDIINKISNYFNIVMEDLVKYTGGYPYKKDYN